MLSFGKVVDRFGISSALNGILRNFMVAFILMRRFLKRPKEIIIFHQDFLIPIDLFSIGNLKVSCMKKSFDF